MPPKKRSQLHRQGVNPLSESEMQPNLPEIPKSKLDNIKIRITNFVNSEDAKKMSIDAVKAIILAIAIAGFSYGGLKGVEKLQNFLLKNNIISYGASGLQPVVGKIFNAVKKAELEKNPRASDAKIKNDLIRYIYTQVGNFIREHYNKENITTTTTTII